MEGLAMGKRLGPTIAAAAALLAATASAGSAAELGLGRSAAGRAPAASGTLTEAISTDPGNLDPQLTVVSAARYVGTFSYDTLVNLVGPGKVVSGLAQKWKVVSPTKVQFTLRRAITCSDGTRMTASVVKQNLDFVGNPANKSPLLGVFMPVGATTIASNRTRTVVVTTKTPNPFMLQGLALVQIVCARGLADRKLLDHGAVGSGPYKLVSVVPGDHYTFQRRKGYSWGPAGATATRLPAKVTLKVVTNETTAANLMLTGGVNVVSLTGPDRKRLDKAHLFRRQSVGAPLELFFNENPGHPAADPKIRKALVQALNLSQIGTVGTAGLGAKMTQLTRQDLTPCPGNSVVGSVPAFSTQAARSVLASAAPSVKFLYATDAGPGFTPAAELAQEQLSAAGAKVTLDGQGTAALTGKIFGTGDWDIVYIGIGVATPNQLIGFLSGPTPAQKGTNFAAIDNAQYTKDVTQASGQAGAAGCKFWLDGERALFKAADVAPTSVLTTAVYGKRATFSLGPQGPRPTSFRLKK
jgi:peptide/nickel transport system substrate-binding protein